MARTQGFVGTIEVETRNVSRIWFALTESKDSANWIKIAGKTAWFTLNLEAAERPTFMAELSLIKDAMRDGLHVRVSHEGTASRTHTDSGDAFEVDGVRIFRAPMTFK